MLVTKELLMKDKKKIITIESIKGMGVSIQSRLLKKHYIEKNQEVLLNVFENTLESEFNNISDIESFEGNIIINDGCFAKLISEDIVNAMHQDKIYKKYKKILEKYESLYHKYSMINILLIPKDIYMGHKNLIRKSEIIKTEVPNFDPIKAGKILQILKILDNYVIFQNIKFHNISIEKNNNILEIHEKIKNKINSLTSS
jgi:hypothetical protein